MFYTKKNFFFLIGLLQFFFLSCNILRQINYGMSLNICKCNECCLPENPSIWFNLKTDV